MLKIKNILTAIFLFIVLFALLNNTYSRAINVSDYSIVNFKLNNQIIVNGNTQKIIMKCILPQTIKNKQDIIGLSLYPQPQKIFLANGNKYAEYEFYNPKSNFNITITGKAKLYRYDQETAIKNNFFSPIIGNKTQYLKSEKYIESDNPQIKQLASALKGVNQEDTIYRTYNYVIKNLKYDGYNSKEMGALTALKTGKGDCSEFSEFLVALCRANNIPAKVVYGYTSIYKKIPKHAWVEIYTDRCGWVPFDPTKNGSGQNSFSVLPPDYIYFSSIINDDILYNNCFSGYYYYGAPIKLIDTFSVQK